MSRIVFSIPIFFLMATGIKAQPVFKNPLLTAASLSGTFAEIRNHHFHSGIDLRTNETEGLPVLASADGFISRIKVSSTGFGNVVYLKHSTGFTTVYAHLHHFNDTIEKLVEAEQYRKKSFEVELFPAEGSLKVNQGQLLGFSGNTGSSAGPHLHFEIRDSKSEKPFNPLTKLGSLADTINPEIRNIMLIDYAPFQGAYYPLSRTLLPVNDPEAVATKHNDTLIFTSLAGIAVETFDRMNGSDAMLGIQKISLKVNGAVVYEYEVENFSFGETRFVNACIDYEQLAGQGKTFILLHHLPGNDFSALASQKNAGFINADWNNPIPCEVLVTDFNGNRVSHVFHLKKEKPQSVPVLPEENKFISFNKTPLAQNAVARIEFPNSRVTYNIHDFEFLTTDTSIAEFSSLVKAGHAAIPLHHSCDLFIKTKNLPVSLRSKAVIVRLTEKNERVNAGGVFHEGWVKTSIRTPGNFFVTVDTLAPVIKPSGVSTDLVWQRNKISFRLTDNLTGIEKYEMTIDGKWVPAAFDAKTGNLVFIAPAGQVQAERSVKVMAEDQKGNITTLTGKYIF